MTRTHTDGFNAKGDALWRTLHAAIAHGDAEHRAWLAEAIEAHFNGRPVPEPRGKGTNNPKATPA